MKTKTKNTAGTFTSIMRVGDVEVEVVRKRVKNLNLTVKPPDGAVRVSVPRYMDDEAVRLALLSRLDWIRTKQRFFRESERQPEREMVSGESHYFRGRRYRLEVAEAYGRVGVETKGQYLRLTARPGTDRDGRIRIINDFYRSHVGEEIPKIVAKWEPIIEVSVREWGVKRMKTRWGSCNIRARRIWLNSELAKKPPGCLEYVVVHEMVHLLERNHTARFRSLMDKFLPSWRLRQAELDDLPLAREDAG